MDPRIIEGIACYLVYVFSATIHEAAHAWAAKRGGDLTAYHEGQVSIDPLPHIRREPVGMVLLPLLSIVISGWPLGFASAPYDAHWAARHPRRAAWMALAGPGANLLVVLLTGAILSGAVALGVLHAPDYIRYGQIAAAEQAGIASVAAFILGLLFCQNLLLLVFNLLPFPPLDGSAALPLVLSKRRAAAYSDFLLRNPGAGFVGLFVAWMIFHRLFQPVFVAAVSLLYPGVTYH